jgi:hypothetical protein
MTKAITETVGVCVAVIGNINVTRIITKAWTISGITRDCPPLLFRLQSKSPLTGFVPILQCENETFLIVIRFPGVLLVPFN